jgi:hypothetical protein
MNAPSDRNLAPPPRGRLAASSLPRPHTERTNEANVYGKVSP